MSTVTKLVLGAMGKLRPEPANGKGAVSLALPPPQTWGGTGLMQALADRLPLLSNLLWAACGVNRADGGRTAPSALNAQEVEVRAERVPVRRRQRTRDGDPRLDRPRSHRRSPWAAA